MADPFNPGPQAGSHPAGLLAYLAQVGRREFQTGGFPPVSRRRPHRTAIREQDVDGGLKQLAKLEKLLKI